MSLSILQTVLEAFIFLYYTFILLTIATSRENLLRNAFYILFVSTGIADIISLLSLFVLRLYLEPTSCSESRYIFLPLITAARAASAAHMIGNTFIAFNRYSSICFMYTYDKIWTRRNVFVIVAVQYAVSIAAVSYNVTSKIVYAQRDNGSYEFQGLEPHIATITGCIYSTLVVVCTLTSFGLNVRLYIERRKLLKEGNFPTSRHAEKGLLIYTITAFISMVVMSAVDALFAVASATHNRELFTWGNDHVSWINDCTVSVPPLFLLLLSPHLRRAVLNNFRIEKPPTFVRPVSHTLVGG